MTETFKSLNLVAPTITPLERKGFCTIHVDSRPADRKTDVMRDTIKIKFDTTIKNNDNLKSIKPCANIDEDPLNDCKPVNCEHYYNGVKNYYDKRKRECVSTSLCSEDENYDANENDCKRDEVITEWDLNFLKSLAVRQQKPHNDLIIIKTVHPKKNNVSKFDDREKEKIVEVSSTLFSVEVEESTEIPNYGSTYYSHTSPVFFNNVVNETTEKKCTSPVLVSIKHAIDSSRLMMKNNKNTVLILILVIILQCSLLIAMSYYLECCTQCCKKKKLKCQFFNYRQDASITTPLIGTSNMDTETTGFNYVSESSYIDKKIKCYKACQKQPADAQFSMSDDILTKYLNRRDWNTKVCSDTAHNKNTNLKTDTKPDFKVKRKDDFKTDRKGYETEVIAKKERQLDRRNARTKDRDVESCKSETEIQCLDYSFNNDHAKQYKKSASVSSEKGAQACFSNDSVDDFLSEKGLLLFGDNISKYSLNSSSPARSSFTDTSSKTSKNNILRHFISYLSRKSKLAVTSEPGKASKDKLELLHMSKASLQSSSDSNIKKFRGSKFFKESRSTF